MLGTYAHATANDSAAHGVGDGRPLQQSWVGFLLGTTSAQLEVARRNKMSVAEH